MEKLTCEIENARRLSTPLAIALIDVDHFKRINDTHGHLAGDEVLHALGQQLPGKLRDRDSLGRFGGEELLLIMPDASPQQPFLPVERLRRAIAEISLSHNGSTIRFTASFGVAWLLPQERLSAELLERADAALYAAKYGGRNRVEYAATGS
jgi:diguanylate cyclase (GGDEF)-like protein